MEGSGIAFWKRRDKYLIFWIQGFALSRSFPFVKRGVNGLPRMHQLYILTGIVWR